MSASAAAARLVVVDRLDVQYKPVMAQPVADIGQLALLPHVAVGDTGAIREVISRYSRLVWSMARRFERETAEDAVQEVFIDLWKSAARYDAKVAKESTFVMMIARRRLIDRRRRRGTQPVFEVGDELPAVADTSQTPPDVAMEANLAARAIEQLSPGQRDVLLLSICYGMSHQAIADKLAMPLGTVKAHARRGLLAVQAATSGKLEENQS
jgi:RNA polymerase sigma-70 factor, ECF subfamily